MFKNILEKIPVTAAGIGLGFATAGNMLNTFFPILRYIFGIIAAIIFIFVTFKILIFKEKFREDMQNPLIAAAFPAYDMCLMVLMTYLRPFLPNIALSLWITAIILHFAVIAYFIKKFILKMDINLIFASCFVAFVGLGTATITAPVFNMTLAGQILFFFSFGMYLIFLPYIIYRVFCIRKMPDFAKPSCAIIASPGSLCLTGYLSCFAVPNPIIVAILALCCTILIPGGYYFCLITNKKAFYPSYSSYTFPFVVSAFAAVRLNEYLIGREYFIASNILSTIIPFMIIIGVLSCFYVLIRYLAHIFFNEKPIFSNISIKKAA